MGESACLMQTTFSQAASDTTHEAREGNPMHALAGSVSFGRFLSESLAWEKWSSFSHNRYLEDVEKYSRPGSVAQKKAYFEAHYKKIAAKKAEAAASTTQPETQDGVHSDGALDSQMEKCDDHVAVDEPRQATVPTVEEGFIIDSSKRNSIIEMDHLESNKVEVVDPVIEEQVLEKNSVVVESSQLADVGNINMLTEAEPSGIIQMNQTNSEVFQVNIAAGRESLTSMTNAKPMASSLKPSAYSKERKLSSSPAKSTTIPSRKENIATPNNKSARDPVQKKCRTPKSLHMSINFASNQETLASATKTNPAVSSSKPSAYRRASELQSPTTKLTIPLHSRKGNNPTPNSKKSARDPGNKCTSPKSLHTSINFAANHEKVASATKTKSLVSSSKPSVYGRALKLPSSLDKSSTVHSRKENATPNSKASYLVNKKCSTPKSLHISINAPSGTGETDKTSSVRQKTADSRGSGSVSTSKHCPTPLRTPTMASVNGLPKNPSVTPQSEQKSTRTELGFTASGRSKVGAKWHSLSTDRSKSLTTCGGLTRSPTVSSPFSFRTNERAAKRKEKLENKFNAEGALGVQLQMKPKEKAENELNKLHQSFSFKAKPMPDFYRSTGLGKNQIKKIPPTQPRSPKLGRKPITNAVQDSSSLPPRRPAAKNDNSMGVMEKNNRIPTHSITELLNKDTHENSPPNIQH